MDIDAPKAQWRLYRERGCTLEVKEPLPDSECNYKRGL